MVLPDLLGPLVGQQGADLLADEVHVQDRRAEGTPDGDVDACAGLPGQRDAHQLGLHGADGIGLGVDRQGGRGGGADVGYQGVQGFGRVHAAVVEVLGGGLV